MVLRAMQQRCDCSCSLYPNYPPLNRLGRFVSGRGNQQTRRVKRVDTLVIWGLASVGKKQRVRLEVIGKVDGDGIADGGGWSWENQPVQLCAYDFKEPRLRKNVSGLFLIKIYTKF